MDQIFISRFIKRRLITRNTSNKNDDRMRNVSAFCKNKVIQCGMSPSSFSSLFASSLWTVSACLWDAFLSLLISRSRLCVQIEREQILEWNEEVQKRNGETRHQAKNLTSGRQSVIFLSMLFYLYCVFHCFVHGIAIIAKIHANVQNAVAFFLLQSQCLYACAVPTKSN